MDKSIKKRVNELETKYAKKYDAKKTLVSGATVWGKGDYVDDIFMYDLKSTVAKKSITFKVEDMDKAYQQALEYNPAKIPVIHLDISGKEYFVLLPGDFCYLRDCMNECMKGE